jgi:hypothetical protein
MRPIRNRLNSGNSKFTIIINHGQPVFFQLGKPILSGSGKDLFYDFFAQNWITEKTIAHGLRMDTE